MTERGSEPQVLMAKGLENRHKDMDVTCTQTDSKRSNTKSDMPEFSRANVSVLLLDFKFFKNIATVLEIALSIKSFNYPFGKL